MSAELAERIEKGAGHRRIGGPEVRVCGHSMAQQFASVSSVCLRQRFSCLSLSPSHLSLGLLCFNSNFLVYFQDDLPGQALLDVVFARLNLIETSYFGIRYIDEENQTVSVFLAKTGRHCSF